MTTSTSREHDDLFGSVGKLCDTGVGDFALLAASINLARLAALGVRIVSRA
ncbi:MAG TPA: hypothetical protein VF331_19960 [Polyangiales bacterium]